MKFFREFGSCCGAATVAPSPPRKSDASSRSSGRSAKVNSAHWKPALSAISENGVVSDVDSSKMERTVKSQKKASAKARSSATAKSPSHRNDYWNDSMLMALPVFSPTPFIF